MLLPGEGGRFRARSVVVVGGDGRLWRRWWPLSDCRFAPLPSRGGAYPGSCRRTPQTLSLCVIRRGGKSRAE